MVFNNDSNTDLFVFDKKMKGPVLKESALNAFKKEEDQRFLCIRCFSELVFACGEIRKKYFRHASGKKEEECKCLDVDNNSITNYCNETLAHKSFKKDFHSLIEKKTIITIPPYFLSSNDYNFSNDFPAIPLIDGTLNRYHENKKTIIKERRVRVLNVKEEVFQETNDGISRLKNKIKPDLEITCEDVETKQIIEYNIEAVVTHAVDNIKFKKIVVNKKNCIQVYLKKFIGFTSLLENESSRYIYSTEIDNGEAYKDLYKEYANLSCEYNRNYLKKHDYKDIAYGKNNQILLSEDDGFCFYCDNELFYDEDSKTYRHRVPNDFLECVSKDTIKANFKILKYLTKDKKFKLEGPLFSLNVDNDFNVGISEVFFYEKITESQIFFSDMRECLRKPERIKINNFVRLTQQQQNMINNANYLYEKKANRKAIETMSFNNICIFCNGQNRNHEKRCFIYRDSDFFQRNIDEMIDLYYESKFNNELKKLKKEWVYKSNFVKKIHEIFRFACFDSDYQIIFNDENNQSDIYFVNDSTTLKIADVMIGYRNRESLFPVLFIDYDINKNNQVIKIKEDIINMSLLLNNVEVKKIIERGIFLKSNHLKLLENKIKKEGLFFDIEESNMKNYMRDKECYSVIYEGNNYKSLFFSMFFNKDNMDANHFFADIKYYIDQDNSLIITYQYIYDNLLLDSNLIILLVNSGYLKGLSFSPKVHLFPESIFFKFANINEVVYDVNIRGRSYTFCIGLNNIEKSKYSFYIDLSSIKYKSLEDKINFLANGKEKLIIQDLYKVEKQCHENAEINKLREYKKQRLDFIIREKIKKKNLKKQYLLDFNNRSTAYISRFKKEVFFRYGKIYSLKIKHNRNHGIGNIFKVIKVLCINDKFLVIPEYKKTLSIRDNFLLFMMSSDENMRQFVLKDIKLYKKIMLYDGKGKFYLNNDSVFMYENMADMPENIDELFLPGKMFIMYPQIFIIDKINKEDYKSACFFYLKVKDKGVIINKEMVFNEKNYQMFIKQLNKI